MFRAYLMDTMSGQLAEPIDLPNVRWSVTVSDCSLSTVRGKGVGEAAIGGLQLPWTAVPGDTPAARRRALASYRRAVCLMWEDESGMQPVVVGAIGDRVDSWLDTSFEIVSMMGLLGQRILVDEGAFGKGNPSGTTTRDIAYRNLSLRAIASDMGRRCTDAKPGGALPIDWSYLGEAGRHSRTYYGFNARNNAFDKLLGEITNVQNGPDAQLRPYIAEDGAHVRHRLVMGTDADPTIDEAGLVPTLTFFPGGGTIENVKVAHAGPTMRVYANGAGQDKAQLCCLAEDMSLVTKPDPWPLVESSHGFTDDSSLSVLQSHARGRLAAMADPICQVEGDVWLDDPNTPGFSEMWAGQRVDVQVRDHPGLADGTYEMRLMEMSGDATPKVHLVFDPIIDPLEA